MMLNKIIAWIWIIWNIVALFATSVYSPYYTLSLIYVVGNIYFTVKYLEKL